MFWSSLWPHPGHPAATQLHHSLWQPKHGRPRQADLRVVPQIQPGGEHAGETLETTAQVSESNSRVRSLLWSRRLSGPFQGVRTPILQLSGMEEGDYTVQLTVTDSAGQQDTAQVTVIVRPGKQEGEVWSQRLAVFSI